MKYNLLYSLSLAVLTLVFLFIIYLGFVLLYPFKVADVDQPYKVLTPIVKRGDILKLQLHYHKYMPIGADVVRYIECTNGDLLPLTPYSSNLPQGTHTIVFSIDVPTKTSLGKCRYINLNTYEISIFRKIQKDYKSEYFTVVD